MHRVLGVTIVCLLAVATVQADGLKDLNGNWIPSEGQLNGKKAPDDFISALKLTIADGKYTVTVGELKDTGKLSVDASKKPATMDIQAEEGPNKGKTILAIYELSGDTLKICYQLGAGERPKDFQSTKDNKQFVVTYNRQKK